MYGVIVSKSSMKKYNIFADPLCFEIKNRRQGPKTAGYRRKPAAILNPALSVAQLVRALHRNRRAACSIPARGL